MPIKKSKASVTEQEGSYYLVYGIQRVSLLLAAAGTVMLWITLVATANDFSFLSFQNLNNSTFNTGGIQSGVLNMTNNLRSWAEILSFLAVLATLFLLKFARVRKYDKRIVIDGLILSVFFLIISIGASPIYRSILDHATR